MKWRKKAISLLREFSLSIITRRQNAYNKKSWQPFTLEGSEVYVYNVLGALKEVKTRYNNYYVKLYYNILHILYLKLRVFFVQNTHQLCCWWCLYYMSFKKWIIHRTSKCGLVSGHIVSTLLCAWHHYFHMRDKNRFVYKSYTTAHKGIQHKTVKK